MLNNDIIIRPFENKDRQSLKTICCDVADKGRPIEGFFPDRDFAADVLTTYYTDYEPQSTFVADLNGKVVGYLTGCVDNRRYGLVVFWILFPGFLLRAFVGGLFFRREFFCLVAAALKNWQRWFTWRKKSFHSHQGHLHIGIAAGFRKQHIGEGLVKAFLEYAQKSHVAQIEACVHDGNVPACRFFERLGFKVTNRQRMLMASGSKYEEYYSLNYAKNITSL